MSLADSVRADRLLVSLQIAAASQLAVEHGHDPVAVTRGWQTLLAQMWREESAAERLEPEL